MKKPSIDLLCTCGHLNTEHTCGMFERVQCLKQDTFNNNKRCKCTWFSLDNLLYLEQLDKEYYLGSK